MILTSIKHAQGLFIRVTEHHVCEDPRFTYCYTSTSRCEQHWLSLGFIDLMPGSGVERGGWGPGTEIKHDVTMPCSRIA